MACTGPALPLLFQDPTSGPFPNVDKASPHNPVLCIQAYILFQNVISFMFIWKSVTSTLKNLCSEC
jgi:hypothetical protein